MTGAVGIGDGAAVDGIMVGRADGSAVGVADGSAVGVRVADGIMVGTDDDGIAVETADGTHATNTKKIRNFAANGIMTDQISQLKN